MKIAYISTHPIYYHQPFLTELSNSDDIDLKVLYCSRNNTEPYFCSDFNRVVSFDAPLFKDFDYIFFKNLGIFKGSINFTSYFNPTLINHLFISNYDYIILHGHNYLTHTLVILLGKFLKAKILLRTISYDLGQSNSFKSKLRSFIYSYLYSKIDYFFYIGIHNKNFFLSKSVPNHKLFYTPHIVNNDFFVKNTNIKKSKKSKIDILFVGKITRKKNPLLLINAFKNAFFNRECILHIVGDGPLLNEYKMKCEIDGLGDKIKFYGFLNQSELPPIYSLSDIFVLPSSFDETWGLVVNEAMNCNNAIIVSDMVGCSADIKSANSGIVFRSENEKELTTSLEKLVNNPTMLNEYKINAKKFISNHSATNVVKGIKSVIQKHG